jgi:hypothetical protein
MPSYTAPVKDMQFVLHDVLKVTAPTFPAMPIWTKASPPPCWKRRANWPPTCWRR